MKNSKLLFFLSMAIFASNSFKSQTLTEISAPTGFDASINQYDGFPFIGNGNLYLKYQSNTNVNSLVEFDGTTMLPLSSPVSHPIYAQPPIVYNGKMYAGFQTSFGLKFDMGEYDGVSTSITNIPSPAGYNSNFVVGHFGEHIEYNGKLYIKYEADDGHSDLMEYDGVNLTTIPTPTGYNSGNSGYEGEPFIHNGLLYLRYKTNAGNFTLFSFDGNNLVAIPSPIGYVTGGYFGNPIIYNGKLCMLYSDGSLSSLAEYDGSSISIIPSPPGYDDGLRGYQGDPIIFNSKLYLRYQNNAKVSHLFEYDGTNLTEITSPASHSSEFGGYSGSPVIYQNKLFLGYYGNRSDLFSYDGTSLTLFNSPLGYDNSQRGYSGLPIVHDNKLYLKYRDNSDNYDLMEFDGSSFNPIPSLTGYTGINKGYLLDPIIYDGNLYMRHRRDDDSYGLIRLNPCLETTSSITASSCDAYTSPSGKTWTTSGTYNDTIDNSAGCDSVITVSLTILNSTLSTDIQTACNSYTWIDGNTYTSSNNSATHIVPNSVGCDSIITLALTINEATSSIDTHTECDSFTWIDGNIYTSDNSTATHIIPNSVGCDSVITLDLTINNSTSSTDTQVACNSYTWIDGNTYTASNSVAMHTLTNSVGCDSIVSLDLTINSPTSGTDIVTTCASSYAWIDGNNYTTDNSTATHILTNVSGCDSTVTLNLTFSTFSSGTDIQIACGSFTWIDGNTYTSSNNSATHTIVGGSIHGCDSIVNLDLTINTVDVSITQNGLDITANLTGANYQWIDCDNGNMALTGEIVQVFTATVNGNYAVIVDDGICEDTSACVNITNVGIENQIGEGLANIYPNPNNGQFQIDLTKHNESNYDLQILDAMGKIVFQKSGGESIVDLNIDNISNGIYFIRLKTKGQYETTRLIIQK